MEESDSLSRDYTRHFPSFRLIGDCQYRHLRISRFDWPLGSKGFVPGKLTLTIGCVGADSIDNPQSSNVSKPWLLK